MALQQALRAGSTPLASRRSRAALAPPRSRSSSVVVRAGLGGLGSGDAVGLARAVGTVAAAVAAGLWLRDEMQQQERLARESPTRRTCPTCEGRGYEPCACTRWSDGDAGCRSCSNSGYSQCRSCGGGGTAVPIKVTIRSDGR